MLLNNFSVPQFVLYIGRKGHRRDPVNLYFGADPKLRFGHRLRNVTVQLVSSG